MAQRKPDNDKDLRHLHRADLLELLEELSRENDRLRAELAAANEKLASRDLALSKCGSLAEASLALSGIFEAADGAARTYVDACRRAAGDAPERPERPEHPERAERPAAAPAEEPAPAVPARSEAEFADAVSRRLAEKRTRAKHAKHEKSEKSAKGGKHAKKHKGRK